MQLKKPSLLSLEQRYYTFPVPNLYLPGTGNAIFLLNPDARRCDPAEWTPLPPRREKTKMTILKRFHFRTLRQSDFLARPYPPVMGDVGLSELIVLWGFLDRKGNNRRDVGI